MRLRWALLVIGGLLPIASTPMRSQTPAAPATASGCLAALRTYRAGTPTGDAAAFARRCADRLVENGLRSADMPILAALYDSAGDPARANGYLALREIGVRIPSKYASFAIDDAKPAPAAFSRAESALARLEALPATVSDLKLLGNQKMLMDAKLLLDHAHTVQHARRILELASSAQPRTSAVEMYVGNAAADLAQTLGDSGLVDQANQALADARGLVSPETYRDHLHSLAELYGLVGAPAPAIEAAHWVNAPKQRGPRAVGDGKVTVIQFTGVACAPCRASYPAFKKLYAELDHSKFDMVFATQLVGVFDGNAVTQSRELAATTDYYTKRHALTFPIAVADGPAADVTAKRYHFAGLPQTVVVDKKGVIRRITIGWDSTSKRPLEKLVSELLAER